MTEKEKIEKERQDILTAINKLDIESSERKFLLRKLANLTQKLLDQIRIGK
jgi:hypothetical protein